MSKIVLDVVGGDHGPSASVGGLKLAVERGHVKLDDVILVGPAAQVREALAAQGLGDAGVTVEDAPDLLEATDSPVDAMRKKPRNSIMVGIQLVKAGRAAAFISAGSTGTVVATATVELRCLEGIRRPGIGAIIHGEKGPFLVIDVGANPQPKPQHIAQYALMGTAYYRDTFGVPSPKVGMLNIGSEELKGNALVKEARQLIKASGLNFAGNVEGVEVFQGECQVVVCDGFTGNVLLKVSEGVAEYVLRTMAGLMQQHGVEPQKLQKIMGAVLQRVDYSEYGGALLLGVEGIVTICHGRSEAVAFCNALRFAAKADAARVNQHIVAAARAAAAPSA